MAGLFEDGKENKVMNAIFFVNTRFHFMYLEPDFSNIIDVYNNNLNIWYLNNSDKTKSKNGTSASISNGILKEPDNFIFSKTKEGFELTEVDFIDSEIESFEFFQVEKLTLVENKKFDFYREFLLKHRSQIEWSLKDYYNHYINVGRFGFTYLRTFKSKEFNEINDWLLVYKKRYDYIFNRLNDNQRIEFVNDYLDQLNKLKSKQTESKFIEVIQKMYNLINDEYNNINRKKDLRVSEYKNAILPKFINILKDNPSNNFFYKTQLTNFENKFLNEVGSKKDINHIFIKLSKDIFKLFECYYNINNNDFDNSIISNEIYLLDNQIKGSLSNFKALKLDIKNDKKLKRYCLDRFDEFKVFIEFHLYIDVENSPLNELFTLYYNLINDIEIVENAQPQQTETVKPDNAYKTQNLFKVGLLFADGTMTKYYHVNSSGTRIMNDGFTPPKIAKELKNIGYNKYILASMNNYKDKENANKNIFNSNDMMLKVINHCNDNNIPIEPYFNSQLQSD